MPESTAFNLADNQKAERKLLITAVDVKQTGDTPIWEIIGAGIEESAIEMNPEVETKTDITGVTETTIKKTEPKQTFEPYTIRGGSKLAFILDEIITKNELSKLSMFDVIIVKGYVGQSGTYKAEVHKNSTISVNSYGGSSNVDMPIDIHYSNDKIFGTVDKLEKDFTFTQAVSV